jgi:CheY-like chemotaxis protein
MHSDVVKVRQSLLNLLGNASKFTARGEIELSAIRTTSNGKDELLFRVTDTGIGMSADQLDKLFRRFTQADASTTRRFGGTGLGLAITKAFCTLLGGSISVESTPDKGTTFTIRLPADVRSVRPASALAEEVPKDDVDLSRSDRQNLVLVIDDDPAMRDLLGRFLNREGFAVRTAKDGETGLRYVRELRPSAVLLDVMMPHVDGWTVLSTLKADPELASIPVIMITFVQQKGLAFSLGAADYLTKPIEWGRLKTVLERFRLQVPPGRALVIEGDPKTRSELRDLLEHEGWNVVAVEDAQAGLQQLVENSAELIVADLHLPGMSGIELLRRLRQNPDWRAIPVIAVTESGVSPAERDRLHGQVRQIVQTGDDAFEAELIAELRRIGSASRQPPSQPTDPR